MEAMRLIARRSRRRLIVHMGIQRVPPEAVSGRRGCVTDLQIVLMVSKFQ